MTAKELFELYKQLPLTEILEFRTTLENHTPIDEMFTKDNKQSEIDRLSELAYRISVAEQAINFNKEYMTYFTPEWITKNILNID